MGLNLGGLIQGALNKASSLVSPSALSRVESKLPGKIKAAVGLGTGLYGLLGNPQKAQGEGLRSNVMGLLSMLTGGLTDAARAGESPEEAARAMASLNAPSPSPVAAQPSSQISAPTSERAPGRASVPIPGKLTSSFSQTPQSSAPAVSPQALAQIASGGAPSAPVGSPTPFSAPAPATPSLAMSSGISTPATGIQAAVLRRLAERGKRQTPAGYVGVPETMPMGAAPRRRLRTDDNY